MGAVAAIVLALGTPRSGAQTSTQTLAPATVAFETAVAGDRSAPQTLTFTSTSTVTVNGVGVTGPFEIVTGSTCGAGVIVGPGSAGCTVRVVFAPTGPGAQTGAVTLTYNADVTRRSSLTGSATATTTTAMPPDTTVLPTTAAPRTSTTQPATTTTGATTFVPPTTVPPTTVPPTVGWRDDHHLGRLLDHDDRTAAAARSGQPGRHRGRWRSVRAARHRHHRDRQRLSRGGWPGIGRAADRRPSRPGRAAL